MTEGTKRARRRRADDPSATADDQQSRDTTGETADEIAEATGPTGRKGQSLHGELRDAITEAALEVLRPVAREATKTAAKSMVTKGPDLVKDRIGPMISKAGGAEELAKSTLSKGGGVLGGVTDKIPGAGKHKGGGKPPTGTGRARRLPVQEFVDVAVPIDVAYDQFTQFEEFPNFMHRVEKIEQRDDSTLMWHENIWGVRRSWEAEIIEQRPCERIVWRSAGGVQTVGVVTFHRLSDRLTRVYVNHDFQPKGLFEKAASGMRMSRRALKSDLMRFKAFIEMRDESSGAWRGLIEDGEVREPDDAEGQEAEGRAEEDEESPRQSQRFTRTEAEADEAEEAEAPEDEGDEEDLEGDEEDLEADEEDREADEEYEEPEAEAESYSDDDEDEDEDEEREDEPEVEEPPASRRRGRARGKTATTPRR